MYNRTVADIIFEAKDEFVAILSERCWELTATVLFMAMIPWGRKFWLNVLHFGMFIKGVLCLIFPARVTSRIIVGVSFFIFLSSFNAEGELDNVHVTMIQMAGLLLLMWVFSYWLVSKSTDSTIVTSFLWTTAIMMTCLLICSGYVLTHPSKKGVKFQPKAMTSAFYGLMLYTLGTYYYAMRSNDWGGYGEVASRANVHLRLDFVLLMTMGVSMFTLPHWLLQWQIKAEKIDSFHAYLARSCAAVVIAMGLMIGRSANFLRGSDKHAIMLSHLMYYVFAISIGWFLKWNDIKLLSWNLVVLFAIIDLSSVVNAIAALNFDPNILVAVTNRARQMPYDAKVMYRDVRNMIKLKRR